MDDGAVQAAEARGPVTAAVGGWLTGVASALFAVIMVVGSLKPDREWGILGGLYELRALVLVALVAWVGGVICFAIGWFQLAKGRPLSLTAGIFWSILAASVLVATILGATGGVVTILLILGLIVMLLAYTMSAVALKDLAGSEPGGPGVWGFSMAAALMILSVASAFLQMPMVFIASIGLVWVAATVGFIAGGMAMARARRA